MNPEACAGYTKRNIIANPNCSTMQMVVALKPLHDLAKVQRVVVSTYQSVSGAGRDAMDELFNQTRAIYINEPVEKQKFTKQIAFNVIPQIDVFMEDGATKEEWKMVVETKKILDPSINVHRDLRAGAGLHRPFAKRSMSSSSGRSRPKKRVLRCARARRPVVDHRADEGYVTPVESAGDDRVLCQPHPRGPHSRERTEAVGGLRQPPQRCGTQHGADRRSAGPRLPEEVIGQNGNGADPVGGPHRSFVNRTFRTSNIRSGRTSSSWAAMS